MKSRVLFLLAGIWVSTSRCASRQNQAIAARPSTARGDAAQGDTSSAIATTTTTTTTTTTETRPVERAARRLAQCSATGERGPCGPYLSATPAIDVLLPFGSGPFAVRTRIGVGFEPFSNIGFVVSPVLLWRPLSDVIPVRSYFGAEARVLFHLNQGPMATFRPALFVHGSVVTDVSGVQTSVAPSNLFEVGVGLEARVAPPTRYFDIRPSVSIARVIDIDGREPGAWYGVVSLGVAIGGGDIPPQEATGDPSAVSALRQHVLADLLHDVPPSATGAIRACLVDIPNQYTDLDVDALPTGDCGEADARLIKAPIQPQDCAVWIAQATRSGGIVSDIDLRVTGADNAPLGEDRSEDDWPTVFVCNPSDTALQVNIQGNARSVTEGTVVAAAIARFNIPLTVPNPIRACDADAELDDSSCAYRMNPGDQRVAYAPPGGRVCVRAPAYSQVQLSVARIGQPDASLGAVGARSLSNWGLGERCQSLDPSGDGYRVSVRVPESGSMTVPVIVWHESVNGADESLRQQTLAARLPTDVRPSRLRDLVPVSVLTAMPPFTTAEVTGQVLGRDRTVPVTLRMGTQVETPTWSRTALTTHRFANASASSNGFVDVSLQNDGSTARVAVRARIHSPRWSFEDQSIEWVPAQNSLAACEASLNEAGSCMASADRPVAIGANLRVCFATRDGHGVVSGEPPTEAPAYNLTGPPVAVTCPLATTPTTFTFSGPTLVYRPPPRQAPAAPRRPAPP